jgi:dipeptidyl aminopeptidase/acylaminoacyl peptidase
MSAAAGGDAAQLLDLADGPEVRIEKISFYSDGLRLAGVLVAPVDTTAGGHAGLVCSHGWSGAVNFRALPLLGRLAQAGYVSICLDHRGFGESEGVRARCDPAEQVRDTSAAATYLASREEVDPGRLGVLGASFGGAIAVAAAAADRRLGAAVAMVPMGNGAEWLEHLNDAMGPNVWSELQAELAEDDKRRVLTGSGARVPMTTLMPLPPNPALDAEAAIMAAAYPDGYPLENASLARDFSPEDVAGKIAPRALLVISTADDVVIPAAQSERIFANAGEPKALHVFPEGNHGGPLGPLVDQTAKLTIEFLGQHLAAGGTSRE